MGYLELPFILLMTFVCLMVEVILFGGDSHGSGGVVGLVMLGGIADSIFSHFGNVGMSTTV
jgi:hypothetical protein